MRPVKLTAQAFGPFADCTMIDFRAVDRVPLFGIYGPTGSGKTSVLDAICFALFGESSGGERSPDHLRSHHADAAEETFVELIFAIGNRRFLIRRSPTQEVARKRGAGMTTRQHEAHLFEVTMLDLETIAYPDNPGRVLAERKVTTVNTEIEKLLGYSASQFRQVVILPQGRFRDLLVAKSPERSQILRQLFDTDLYERITERLKTQRSEIKADLDRTDQAKKTLLESAGVASEEALLATIEEKARACNEAIAEVDKCDRIKADADEALRQGQALMTKFVEFSNAQAAYQELTNQSAAINAKREELHFAIAAARVVPVADRADAAAKRLQKTKDDYKKKLAEAQKATMDLAKAQEAYENSKGKKTEREELRRQQDQFKRYQTLWEELADHRNALGDAQNNSIEAEKAFNTSERKVEKARKTEVKARQENEKLAEAKTDQVKLQMQIEALERNQKTLKEMASIKTQITKKKKAMEQVASEVETQKQAMETKKSHHTEVEEGFLASSAAHLAIELKFGEPCPVCGSKDHPAPAERREGTLMTREDLDAARTAVTQTEAVYAQSVETLNKLRYDLNSLEERLHALTAEIPATKTLVDVKAELEPLQANLDAATTLTARETAIRQAVREAESALHKASQALDTARDKKQAAAERVVQLQASLDAALREIPEPLRDKDKIITECDRLKNALQTAVQHHQALEKTYNDATSNCSSKSALVQEAEIVLKEIEEEVNQARTAFEAALKAARFEAEEAFRTAYRDDATITTLREAIDGFERDKKSAEDRLSRAIVETEGQSRPDLEVLQSAVAQAKIAADQARVTKTSLEAEKSRLEQTRQQFQDKAREYDRLDQVYRKIALLSEVADGRGANAQRIRLVDYVLSAYFDDILRQANVRFGRMSKGRYRLCRKQTPTSLRGSAGLEISVYDAYTDQERDAATLSGGESFLAALSLALGLSDVVQAETGGIRLDAIFIDEGFGHLDEEALDEALDTLVEISGHSRSVGIISHVEEVKRMVPQGFDIVRAIKGSDVRVRQPVS